MRFNLYGQMILTKKENVVLNEYLLSHPCPVCGTGLGKDCKRVSSGVVHMGRVPDGYDAAEVLREWRAAKARRVKR
jgi:hypothetical protein